MVLYAESSALLAWLLGQDGAGEIADTLGSASLIVTSDLTHIECARAVHRARATGLVTDAQARALHADYADAAAQWDVLPIGERVAHLASAPWPVEPVRALDAIHLASVLLARDAWPGIRLLTRDRRIGDNAAALGLALAGGAEGEGRSRPPSRPHRG
jgi:predicted nucleic acid-binding protein